MPSASIFNSPRVQLQGRFGGFYNYNLAVKKELFRKKGNVSLGLDNPFTRAVRMESFFQSQTFVSHDVRNMYRRGVRVSYNHQFGKMDFNAKPRRRKSISTMMQKAATVVPAGSDFLPHLQPRLPEIADGLSDRFAGFLKSGHGQLRIFGQF